MVMRYICTALLFIQLTYGYSYVDGPIEKSAKPNRMNCPGAYCGRSDLNETHYSACGKCERGWRVHSDKENPTFRNVSSSICQECLQDPKSQEWLFLAFHVMLVLVLHWIAIDLTAMRRKMTQAVLVVHIGATIEVALAAIITLLVTHPVGTVYLSTCRVNRLSDWYTYFHNPNPNYEKTLNCTQEAVYPLFTMVFMFYVLCGVIMLIIRPLLTSKLLPRKGRTSIFAALYFLPILSLIHAVGGGLVYFAYPYIVLILSLISSAFHFAFKLDQTTKSLLIGCARDSRSAMILIGHWLLHAFGIIAIAQERDHNLYLPMLGLVPVPALFYIATVRFSDPDNFHGSTRDVNVS